MMNINSMKQDMRGEWMKLSASDFIFMDETKTILLWDKISDWWIEKINLALQEQQDEIINKIINFVNKQKEINSYLDKVGYDKEKTYNLLIEVLSNKYSIKSEIIKESNTE